MSSNFKKVANWLYNKVRDQVHHLQVKVEHYNLPISSSAMPIKSINL